MASGSNTTLSGDVTITSHHSANESSIVADIETTIQQEEDCTGLEGAIQVRLISKLMISRLIIAPLNFDSNTNFRTIFLCL